MKKKVIQIFFVMQDIDLVDDLSSEMERKCINLIQMKRKQTHSKEDRVKINQINEGAERLTESLNLYHNLVEHGSFFPMSPTIGATSITQKEIRHWEYDVSMHKRVPRM